MSKIIILKTCRGAPFQLLLEGLPGLLFQDREANFREETKEKLSIVVYYSRKDLFRDRKNFIATFNLKHPLDSIRSESPYYKLFEVLSRNFITVKTVKRFSNPASIANLIFRENPDQIVICGTPGAGFWWIFPLKIVAMLKKIPISALIPDQSTPNYRTEKITLLTGLKCYVASLKTPIRNLINLAKEIARTALLIRFRTPSERHHRISIIPASVGNPMYFKEALPEEVSLTFWLKNKRIFQIFSEELKTLDKENRSTITSSLTEALKRGETLIIEFADTPLFPYDVILWKLLGKKIILHLRGCEARDPQTNPGCLFCTLPTCSKQKRRKIHLAGKFADAIVVSTPDLLLGLPIPLLKKSHYIPVLPAQSTEADAENRFLDGRTSQRDTTTVFHASITSPTKGAWLFEKTCHIPIKIPPTTLKHKEFTEELSNYAYYFDQMLLGWFGISSLEALTKGTTPITYLATEDLLKKLPFLKNNPAFAHILKNKNFFINPYRLSCEKINTNSNSPAKNLHLYNRQRKFLQNLKKSSVLLWKHVLFHKYSFPWYDTSQYPQI